MLNSHLKKASGFSLIASFILLFSLASLTLSMPAWAAPAPPTGLTTITGNSEATLSWNTSAGATWYLLYRATASGGPYSFVAQTPASSHTDHGLGNGTPYYYAVTALDASGQSSYSAEATATPTLAVLPAPTAVSTTAGNGQVSLAWNPVTSAVAYNVYRSTTRGGPYALLTPSAPGPSFTDSGLANDTQYFYVVQTLSTNSGAFSDEVNVIPSLQLPPAPTALVATPGSTWARLSWSASAGATGYAVYRATTVGGPYLSAGYSPTTSYEESGLQNGTTYYYVVAAVNAKGQGAFSTEQSAAVSDLGMPHAVELTAVLSGNGQILLSWSNAAGAVSYNVHRATTPGGPYTNLGVQNPNFTDNGRTNGTTYYYVVDSLNAGDIVSRSNEVSLAPVAGGIPSAPGNVAAIPGNTQATVTWNPVAGATGYQVTVAASPGGQPLSFYSYQSGASYTVTGLTNGQTYYFRVQASASGWSAFSTEVSATPSTSLPLAPTSLSTINGNSQVSLIWTEVSDATSYQVYRHIEGTPWPATPLATVTGSTLYNDNGLTNGTVYQYVVAAVNGAGAGARSYQATGRPSAPQLTPAPLNVAVIPGNTQATVTWDPVPGASGYSVIVATSPGGPAIATSGYQAGPSYTVTGLTNTITYYFRVQAAANIWSAFSDEVSITLPTTLPLAPTGLNITGGNSQLSLTWTPVTNATGYRIYRRTEGNPWSATPLGTSTGTIYTDSGLYNGTTYQYLVAAVKAAGAGAWSYSASGKPTAANLPLAPLNVAVTAGYTQATITWDPVPGATNYSVTVATSPGGPNVGVGGYQSGPSFTATGLTNGTTYYFRVQAAASNWSAFSAEVSVAPSSSRLPAPIGLNITSGNTQLTLDWSAVAGATGYTVYRRTAGEAWPATPIGTPTTNSFTDTELINGTVYYYAVKTVNLNGPGAWSQEVSGIPADTTPPDTAITANPADPSTSISAGFSFTSTKPGSTFQCQLDGAPFKACTSPASYTGLAAGGHFFNVKATDPAGNSDPSPASYGWTINTGITTPSGTITINNGATITDKTSVTLTLTCTDPDGCSQMQLSNDNSSWSGVEAYVTTKPWTLIAGDGPKNVYVKFRDNAGDWSNVVNDTITLNTAAKTLIVNRTGTGKGTVTSTPAGINCGAVCQNSVSSSTPVTLSAVAETGSIFVDWGGDCLGISSTTSIVVNNLKICTAQFNSIAPTPAPPAGLTTITGNGEATISWNTSAGAAWYLLYRATASGGPYSFVAQTPASSHTDHGLSNGTPYYYVVTALNASGQSPYSTETTVTPTTAVLPAPSGVTAAAGNEQATLTWNTVTSEVVYNVYRSTTRGGPYTLLTPPTPGPSFTDSGLVNGTQYFYVVQTLSTNSGAFSDEVDVIPSLQLPAAPTALVATPGSTWARLSWSASAGATGYAVYRATTVGGPYSFAGFSPTTFYEESGLQNGTTYYYEVAAVNAKGQGAFSTEQSAAVSDLGMPHAVELSAVLSGNGQILLSWSNAAGAVSYIVHRATIPGGPYTNLGVQNPNFTDNGRTNGTTYYYVVDSLNAGETVSRSNEVSLAPVASGIPSAPGNVAAIPGNTQVTVTWNPVAGATGYNLTVATSPGGQPISFYNYQSGPSYTVTGLTNGQTYYFRVQAAASGWSAFSAEVNATPSTSLPLAPVGLSTINGNSQVSLIWTKVSDATSYQLYRRLEGTPWPATPLATVTGSTLYNDNGLTNGTVYQYLVAAVNGAGAGARSYHATGRPAAPQLTPAPLNVAVIPGNTQATVTWDPVPGATGYSVMVATSPGGPAIATSGYQAGPSYTVTGLTNTITYYFRVQAAANSWSAYSAEVSATPSATLPLAPTGLNVTGGNSQLSLTWTPVTGATGYRIYRRTEGNPWPATPLGTSTGTIFNDSRLYNGTTYQYLVVAVKAAGSGAWSYSASGKPQASNMTTTPINIAVTAGYTQATITWDPVPGATGYYVTAATSPGGPNIGAGGYQSGPSFTAAGLTNGTTYYFRVQAAASNWSAFSTEVSVVPSASRLPAPIGLSITSGTGQLSLAWTAVNGATEYRIFRRTADTPFTIAGSALTNSYDDSGLTNGTRYYYVVETVNLGGPGAWSQEASEIPLDAPMHSLATHISGSGTINNLAQPPSFNCATSSCTSSFNYGTEFTLRATPSSLYAFAGWSGSCTGLGDCILTLTADAIVTAAFTRLPLVQVSSDPTQYYTLQSSYDATLADAVFKARNITFIENFNLNRSIGVTLNGGLDSDFSTVSDYTSIQGTLTVRSGKLTVNRLIIR